MNVTLTVQVLPTANVLPQLWEEIAKLALTVILLMTSVAVPVFFTVTVLAALVWLSTSLPKFSEVGESATFAPVTVRVNSVVCAKLPEVPATATFFVPSRAVPLAVSVSELVLVAGFRLKAALTPFGKPCTVNDTIPSNPFNRLIVIVLPE
jgi:hypothetical protein